MPRTLPTTPDGWAPISTVGPHVDSPYAGAVQDELAYHLVKYLREDAVLRSEVEVEIPASAGWPEGGTGPAYFTLDLVVEVPVDGAPGAVRRVVFEAAGRGRSGRSLRDHERRLRRDATLLAHGAADTVYRLRGSDLVGHVTDVLYLASRWDPELFSERGRINLATLASAEARQIAVRPEQPSVLVPYALADGGDQPEAHLWAVANGEAAHLLIRRLDRRAESVWAPYADRPLRKVEAGRPALRKAS